MARRRGRQWAKLWGEVVRTPKIARLTDSQFRWWINLLAIATEYDGEGEGRLPGPEDVCHILYRRVTPELLQPIEDAIHELVALRLIDIRPDGDYQMHDYRQWQEGDVPAPAPPPAKRRAASTALAPAGDKPLSAVQAAVAGYCDALSMDPRELGGTYGRYSKAFMGLAAAGYSRDDCRKLTKFVATSDYWRGARTQPPPEAVVGQVGAWKASGKPELWTPGMRQVTNGRVSVAGAARQLRGQ